MKSLLSLRRVRPIAFFLVVLMPYWQSCENASQKPLDGKSRQLLDSLTADGIRQARIEMDSLCNLERSTRLPQLVDSLKKIRLREIEEKMRTVPR